ncbi:hypothetical protein Hanom_Chr15g01382991 [Helianthus anomalus]
MCSSPVVDRPISRNRANDQGHQEFVEAGEVLGAELGGGSSHANVEPMQEERENFGGLPTVGVEGSPRVEEGANVVLDPVGPIFEVVKNDFLPTWGLTLIWENMSEWALSKWVLDPSKGKPMPIVRKASLL